LAAIELDDDSLGTDASGIRGRESKERNEEEEAENRKDEWLKALLHGGIFHEIFHGTPKVRRLHEIIFRIFDKNLTDQLHIVEYSIV
jgi:hypothetical protein